MQGFTSQPFYLGKKEGAIVGGLSAFLIDLLSSAPQWMFISLFIHGAQGYFAGLKGGYRPLGLLLATVVMVGATPFLRCLCTEQELQSQSWFLIFVRMV